MAATILRGVYVFVRDSAALKVFLSILALILGETLYHETRWLLLLIFSDYWMARRNVLQWIYRVWHERYVVKAGFILVHFVCKVHRIDFIRSLVILIFFLVNIGEKLNLAAIIGVKMIVKAVSLRRNQWIYLSIWSRYLSLPGIEYLTQIQRRYNVRSGCSRQLVLLVLVSRWVYRW